MSESSLARPPRRFWLIGLIALAWNLIGVMSYLMNVTAGREALAGLSEAERSPYTDIPAWATAAGLMMYSAKIKTREAESRKSSGLLGRMLR